MICRSLLGNTKLRNSFESPNFQRYFLSSSYHIPPSHAIVGNIIPKADSARNATLGAVPRPPDDGAQQLLVGAYYAPDKQDFILHDSSD